MNAALGGGGVVGLLMAPCIWTRQQRLFDFTVEGDDPSTSTAKATTSTSQSRDMRLRR